jgi:GTPase
MTALPTFEPTGEQPDFYGYDPDNDPEYDSADGQVDTHQEEPARHSLPRDDQGFFATEGGPERAVLVGVFLNNRPGLLTLEDSLAELSLLASTAGALVVGEVSQRLDKPNPATLIGTGKLDELQMAVAELHANIVLFDDELSPRQQREIEQVLGQEIKVLDRTALILDIFARHARTREGAVQVELAQYEYRLPRLTRAWTHLARQAGGRAGGTGGGVGVRGPGETQLEVDRREISRRISFLKKQLDDISKHRDQYRRQRRKSGIPVVALVGYTNAGKSTLLNLITSAQVIAVDQLFATLDPTTRRTELPSGHLVLLTDTVGFIQKLPTQLVAAFRATLEEVTEADLLIHVVDASHPNMDAQVAAVEEVLEDLGAGDRPVLTALNKIDRLDRSRPEVIEELERAQTDYSNPVLVSARTGEGLPDLLAALDNLLRLQMVPVDLLIPYEKGDLVALAHQHGFVEAEEHTNTGTHIRGRLPVGLAGRFSDYWTAGLPSRAPQED